MLRTLSWALWGLHLISDAAADPCDYNGGYAARFTGNSCPDDSPVPCGVGFQVRCCPSGWSCRETDTAFCCPPGVNCISDVSTAPQCPDPSWSLWGLSGQQGWCCGEGFFGFSVSDGGGAGCLEYGQSLEDKASTSTANRIEPTPPATCSPSSTSSTSTSTTSASSSTTSSPSPTTSGGPGFAGQPGEAISEGDSSDSDSLSTGAIVGIAVGSAALVAIVALGWCFFASRRRAAAKSEISSPPSSDGNAWMQQAQPVAQPYAPTTHAGSSLHGPYTPATAYSAGYGGEPTPVVANTNQQPAQTWEYYKPPQERVVAELPTREHAHEMGTGS